MKFRRYLPRHVFTQFRISAHNLEIEQAHNLEIEHGIHFGIDRRYMGFVYHVGVKSIEDTFHVFLCNIYIDLRPKYVPLECQRTPSVTGFG